MRKLLLALLFMLITSLQVPAQVTITGNVLTLGLSGSANAKVVFRLENFGSNLPRTLGTGTFVPTELVCSTSGTDCTISAAGVVAGTIIGNDDIDPSGTYYRVCFYGGTREVRCANFSVTGSSFNLDSASPLSSTAVQAVTPTQIHRAYVHTQSVASTSWTINHAFSDINTPCDFYNASEQRIFPDLVTQTDANNVTAAWVVAQTGKAICWNTSNFALLSGTQSVVVTNPTANQSITGGFNLTLDGDLLVANAGDNLCSSTVRCDLFGAATNTTSLVIGGGTSLTTSNQTGTGNLVLATAPTITNQTIAAGVAPDGSGFKHSTTGTTCITAATAGASCDTTLIWGSAFADTDYTTQCQGALVVSGVPVDGGVVARTAGNVTFRTVAATAAAAEFDFIECIGVHD